MKDGLTMKTTRMISLSDGFLATLKAKILSQDIQPKYSAKIFRYLNAFHSSNGCFKEIQYE